MAGEASAEGEGTIDLIGSVGTRTRRSEESLSSVRVEGGKDVHLTLVRCSMTSLEVDGVEGLQLHLIGCSVKRLTLRRLRSGDAFVNMRGGEVGESHLEHCTLAGLECRRMRWVGPVFVRSLTVLNPDTVVITNCEFTRATYIDIHVDDVPPGTAKDMGLDLRKNDFDGPVKLGFSTTAAPRGRGLLSMRGCTFGADTRLSLRSGGGTIDLAHLRLTGPAAIQCQAQSAVEWILDGTVVTGRAALSLAGTSLQARGLVLDTGGRIECGGSVDLEGCLFDGPTTVSSANHGDPVQVTSLRGAEVGQLRLVDTDLRQCHFAGVRGLDSADIDLAPRFWPHIRQRRAIADELDVRHGSCLHGRDAGAVARPADVAVAYRQLRSNLDRARDQPGSADFYYGEMDMRRLTGDTLTHRQRFVLAAYWLTSGYGVRPLRTATSLLLVLALGGILLSTIGLADQQGHPLFAGVLTATELATLRSSTEHLTDAGRVIALPLRLIAPLLFLQLILALRATVRR
jgi:hypothetical protein